MQATGTNEKMNLGAAAAAHPPDKRFAYHALRYHKTVAERDLIQWRQENTWDHASPKSVLVAVMGAHWRAQSWQLVTDMVHYTNAQGINIGLVEVMDRCQNPYDALGAMRNEGIMKAKEGWEYLLYVDCDVLPSPDTLVRLLAWDVAIVAPYVEEPGTGKPLHGPAKSKWSGLQAIRWSVLSMLLFRTSVFNATGPELWNNAAGADEGYHFQKLWHYGHRPYLDTSLMLPVAQPPTYPLATNRMAEQEAKSFWEIRREWLLAPPDRSPIDPKDPRHIDGVYFPFAGTQNQLVETPKVAANGAKADAWTIGTVPVKLVHR